MSKKYLITMFIVAAIIVVGVTVAKKYTNTETRFLGDSPETVDRGYKFFRGSELPSLQDASNKTRDFYVASAYSHLYDNGYTPFHFKARFPSRVGVANTPDGFYLFTGDRGSLTISLVNTAKENEQCLIPMDLEGKLMGEITCGPYWARDTSL